MLFSWALDKNLLLNVQLHSDVSQPSQVKLWSPTTPNYFSSWPPCSHKWQNHLFKDLSLKHHDHFIPSPSGLSSQFFKNIQQTSNSWWFCLLIISWTCCSIFFLTTTFLDKPLIPSYLDDWVVSSLVSPIPSALSCSASAPGSSPSASSEWWQSRADFNTQPLQECPVTKDKAETPAHEIYLAAALPSTHPLLHSPKCCCPLVITSCLAFTVHGRSPHLWTLACEIPLSWNFLSHRLHLMYSYSSFSYAGNLSSRKPPWNPRLLQWLLLTFTNTLIP